METPLVPAAPRKLPGRMRILRLSAGAASDSALWLGPHSVILSQMHFYTESYRQFEYGSIQGMVLRVTSRGKIYNVIGGALAACFAALTLANDDVYGRWFCGAVAAFWGALVVINMIRGSTCRVELQTAVARRELITLNRTRPARRALEMIRHCVELAQGALSPAEAEAQMNEFLAAQPAA